MIINRSLNVSPVASSRLTVSAGSARAVRWAMVKVAFWFAVLLAQPAWGQLPEKDCVAAPGITTFGYSERVNCAISQPGERRKLRFNGQAGEWVDLTMYRTERDVQHCFTMVGSDNVTVASACVDGFWRPALLMKSVTLPATDTYTITAYAGGDNSVYSFAFIVHPVFPPQANQLSPLTAGVTQPGEVFPMAKQVHPFWGLAGDSISLRIVRQSADAQQCLRLIDPDGKDGSGWQCVDGFWRPATLYYDKKLAKSGRYYLEIFHGGYIADFTYNAWLDCTGSCEQGSGGGGTGTGSDGQTVSCTVSLLPASQLVGTAATEASIGVMTPSGCEWSADTQSAYLSIKSGQTGWGPGTITVGVAENKDAASRTGAVTVGNQTATITQSGKSPLLVVTPGSLSFDYTSGATPPGPQVLSIYTNSTTLDYTASTNTVWLELSQSRGKAPGSLTVTMNPEGLTPGTYDGRITISAPTASPSSKVIAVKLVVDEAGDPKLSVDHDSISNAFVLRSNGRAERVLVGNVGTGSLPFHVETSTLSGSDWLAVTPEEGIASQTEQTPVLIWADPSRLPVGTFNGRVAIVTDTERREIPVTATVTANQQTVLLSQTGLTFTAVKGGAVPPPQTFGILNTGADLMDWSLNTTTTSGPDGWLNVTPREGVTDGLSLDVPLAEVAVDTSGLEPGEYNAQIEVQAPAAENSPQYVSVVVNVLPPGSDPGPLVRPTGLIFAESANGAASEAQSVSIATLSSSTRTFIAGKLTSDGAAWFTVTPSSGTVQPDQPVTVTVAVSREGLEPGIRRGVLTLLFSDGAVQTVNLLYVIAPAASKEARAADEGCQPSRLLPLVTSLGSAFNVPAGWPNTLEVKVVDDCGNPMASGSVTATFSNGDAPLPLVGMKDGRWLKTWQVRNSSVQQITVKVSADDPDRALTGNVELTGGVQGSSGPPVLAADAVSNAASNEVSAPVAPGTIVNIRGSKLAFGLAESTAMPLEHQLAGAMVTIGGKVAPLVSASEEKISALLPFGLPVNTRHHIIVRRGNTFSVPEPVTVSATQPAVFTVDGTGGGQAMAEHAEGGLAEPGNPAIAGEVITVYCTGLGATSPEIEAGEAAPEEPLAKVLAMVAADIGGVPATVESATLVPGRSGYYQVKLVVPSGVAADDAPLILSAGGQRSPAVTIAVQ